MKRDDDMQELIDTIERGFERGGMTDGAAEHASLVAAVDSAIAKLDSGELRVAERKDGDWLVNQWLKKAVLLSFRLGENDVVDAGYSRFFDKVPLKYSGYSRKHQKSGSRAIVRKWFRLQIRAHRRMHLRFDGTVGRLGRYTSTKRKRVERIFHGACI